MPKVLVSDPVSEEGIAILRAIPGVEVDVKTGLAPEELERIIGEYAALAVRSETKVTAPILAAAHQMQIIGRAGVGVDNIDVKAATEKGIVVVNSPDGNTLAAAELTVALILSLARNIPQADASMREGKWDRKKFTGMELCGKTVGVVGLGKIGAAVASRLKAFDVELIAYNPFVTEELTRQMGAEPVSLDELFRRSDIITVHTPLNDETRNMIGAAQFAQMKNGVRIVNVARGGIIDEAALADAVKSGKVAGAAVDVFTKEPVNPENPLLGIPQIITVPHLGASTKEAQIKVAIDVCEQIRDVLEGKPARTPVNLPTMSADDMTQIAPYQTLAAKIGSLHMQLARDEAESGRPINAVEVVFHGDFGGLPTHAITRAVLRGLMTPALETTVNLVNAPTLAEARGVKVVEQHRDAVPEHSNLLTVRAHLPGGDRVISGAVFGSEPHIVNIDGYHLDLIPNGHMIFTQHTDKPGIIGKVGTLLGDNGSNIAGMHVGREGIGGRAIMALLVDDTVAPELVAQIKAIPGMEKARLVSL